MRISVTNRVKRFVDFSVIHTQKLCGSRGHVDIIMFALGAFLVEKIINDVVYGLMLN